MLITDLVADLRTSWGVSKFFRSSYIVKHLDLYLDMRLSSACAGVSFVPYLF